MKLSINSKLTALLAVSALAMTGCQDEEFGYTASEIKYATEFANTFGKIDPNQDWNLLAQLANGTDGALTRAFESTTTPKGTFSITVLPESQAASITPEQMKDYSKMLPEIGGSGGNTFDTSNLGRVTQNFSVTTNKVILYPVYWWTQSIDEIGLYYYSNETGSITVTDNEGNDHNIVKVPITVSHPEELEYKYETEAVWTGFYDYNFTTYVSEEDIAYLVNNNSDFVLCDGTQYNTYGETNTDGFSIGVVLQYVGKKSLGNDSPAGNAGTEFDYYTVASYYSKANALASLLPSKFRCAGNNSYSILTDEGGAHWATVLSFLQTFNNNDPQQVDPAIDAATTNTPLNGRLPLVFRSKGIVVDLPVSMKIGFYIKNGSNIMYSEGKLNEKMPETWTGHEGQDQCYIATYESTTEKDANNKPVRYLAFEDWYRSGDFDLNDIVFRVYGFDEIHDEEEITEEGLFVCEDLGSFDFDFNDIVLKAAWKRYYKKTFTTDANGVVTNVEIAQYPSDELTITGMAAGGANPSNVYFKTKTNTSGELLGEIHEILNGSAPTIINADETYGGDGKSYTFDENEFPETWDATAYPTGYISQIFGKSYLYVIASTTNSVPNQSGTDYNHNAEHLITSTSYKTNGVPQMMLLPMYFEWCQESQPIEDVYENFTSWVSDATKTSWLISGKNEDLTTDRGVTPEMYTNNTPSVTPTQPEDEDPVILTESEITVDPTSLSFATNDDAQTIIIKSKNSEKPVVSSGDNVTVSNVSEENDGETDSDGFYSWSVSITPKALGNTPLTITQIKDETNRVKPGLISVSVQVNKPNYGVEITVTDYTSTSYYWSITKSAITEIVESEPCDVVLTCEISGPFSNMKVGNGFIKIEDSSCTIDGNIMQFEFNTKKITGENIAISGDWTANSSSISKAYIKKK